MYSVLSVLLYMFVSYIFIYIDVYGMSYLLVHTPILLLLGAWFEGRPCGADKLEKPVPGIADCSFDLGDS